VLLYIHIPFCRSKCAYCSFFSLPDMDQQAIAGYVHLLTREIALWGRRFGRINHQRGITSIYIGGGTPSLLDLSELNKITAAIGKAFRLAPALEFSIEANPDSCADLDYLRGLLDLGINRLSLGVQSLDNKNLFLLGRRHQGIEAARCVDLARGAGFGNINLDMIWGLPDQRVRDWLKELEKVVELQPEHLSCYNLTMEDHTPMGRAHAQGSLELPPDKEQAKMFLHGADFLESRGYLQYEISNFSRMGFTCRHNLGYWESQGYLGLGAGAVSTMGGRRWENPKNLEKYAHHVRQEHIGQTPTLLAGSDVINERIMLSLRTNRGLNLKEYTRLTGHDFLQQYRRLVQVLRQNDLIRIHSGALRLTREGMLVSNSILEHFLDMPCPGKTRDGSGHEDTDAVMASAPVGTQDESVPASRQPWAPPIGHMP
jgi:putative oxygen-independent coproporphyrinogen III oxidase